MCACATGNKTCQTKIFTAWKRVIALQLVCHYRATATATTAVSVMCFCRKEQPGWVVVNIQKHQQSLLSSKGMGIFIHTWTKLLPESNKMRLVQLKAIWSLYRLSLFTAAERRPCKLQHATSNHIRSQHHPPNRYEKEREREREREREPFCRSL